MPPKKCENCAWFMHGQCYHEGEQKATAFPGQLACLHWIHKAAPEGETYVKKNVQ
jgi:hypothetical protein